VRRKYLHRSSGIAIEVDTDARQSALWRGRRMLAVFPGAPPQELPRESFVHPELDQADTCAWWVASLYRFAVSVVKYGR
jgi:hypothetical protein